MPHLDRFARQLVDMVRQLPDEDLLDLVKAHLDVDSGATGTPSPAPRAQAKPTTKSKRQRGKRRKAGNQAALVDSVEAFVRGSDGVGLADVASGLGEPKSRVQVALRDLKKAGRVAHAGDRRFTRYARNVKTARAASKRARSGG